MSHTDSGAIMAYLDGELPVADRIAIDAHLGTCTSCRDVLEELKSFAGEFTRTIELLDGRIPLLSARAALDAHMHGRPARTGVFAGVSLLKAAAIVLLVAGAASAAIPGTPLRRLVESAVSILAGEPAQVETPAPAPVEPPAPSVQEVEGPGFFLTPDAAGAVHVSIHSPNENARITVRITDGSRGIVKAIGANESFRVNPRSDGRVDVYGVDVGIVVEVPRSLRSVSVDVDGRPFYRKDGDAEPVLAPGVTSSPDGAVFQLNGR